MKTNRQTYEPIKIFSLILTICLLFSACGKSSAGDNLSSVKNTDNEPKVLSLEETVIRYCKALQNFDFAELDKYCLVDFSQVFEKYVQNDEIFNKSFFRVFSDENEKVDSLPDVYSKMNKMMKKLYENSDADVENFEVEVVSKKPLDINSNDVKETVIETLKESFSGIVDENNYDSYVNINNITEIYEVTVKMTYNDSSNESPIVGVKYNGKWCILLNPIWSSLKAAYENSIDRICSSNIKMIKVNAANYYACNNQAISSLSDLKNMFDDKQIPECPLSDNGDHSDDYLIAIDSNTGAATVYCKNCGTFGHMPDASSDTEPSNPLK